MRPARKRFCCQSNSVCLTERPLYRCQTFHNLHYQLMQTLSLTMHNAVCAFFPAHDRAAGRIVFKMMNDIRCSVSFEIPRHDVPVQAADVNSSERRQRYKQLQEQQSNVKSAGRLRIFPFKHVRSKWHIRNSVFGVLETLSRLLYVFASGA